MVHMKYSNIIRTHLDRSGERVDDFARRAGVCRATVFNLLAEKDGVGLGSIKAMLEAAGFSLVPIPDPALVAKIPAATPTPSVAPAAEDAVPRVPPPLPVAGTLHADTSATVVA